MGAGSFSVYVCSVGPPRFPDAALRFASGPRTGLPYVPRALRLSYAHGGLLLAFASAPCVGAGWGQSRAPPAGPSSERDWRLLRGLLAFARPVGVWGGGVGGGSLSSVGHRRRIRDLTGRASGGGSGWCWGFAAPLARPVRPLMRASPVRPRREPHPQAEVLRKSSWSGPLHDLSSSVLVDRGVVLGAVQGHVADGGLAALGVGGCVVGVESVGDGSVAARVAASSVAPGQVLPLGW